MKGGHNRKSSAQKKLEGTYDKSRVKPNAPCLPPGKVPPPPRDMVGGSSPEERKHRTRLRQVWLELAVQVEAISVYSANHYSSFRLMVEAVAATRAHDPNLPATARVRMLQAASSLLQRFGLDPASQDNVSAGPGAARAAETAAASAEAGPPLFGPALKMVKGGGGS